MAPFFSKLRPSRYFLIRKCIELCLNIYWIVRTLPERFKIQRPLIVKLLPVHTLIDELKSLLRKFPWWLRGHMDLGFRELHAAEVVDDRYEASRLINTAKLSAEAVRKLLGPVHLITGGKKQTLLFHARTLEGLIMSRYQRYDESLDILKHVLALNNSSRLPRALQLEALEVAANCAYLIGNHTLSLEYIRRIPHQHRSQSSLTLLRNLTADY